MARRLIVLDHQAHESSGGVSTTGGIRGLLSEQLFTRILYVERKRAERSKRAFLLTILDAQLAVQTFPDEPVLLQVATALCDASRETDLCGWYNERESTIGLVFCELGYLEAKSVIALLKAKTLKALGRSLAPKISKEIRTSFFVFPTEWEKCLKSAPYMIGATEAVRTAEGVAAGSLSSLTTAAAVVVA